VAKKINAEILTVMFIDIVSYTKTTSDLDRENFSRLHDVFDNISLSIFKEHSGKVVKKIGDAYLVTFKSATTAVLCGRKLQEEFWDYNKGKKLKNPLKIRVAIHTGEVLHRNGDIYGDTVNTASRIESITKAGDVVFSEPVYTAMNKNEVNYLHLGLRKLKGLKRPLRIFRIRTRKDEILRRMKQIKKFWKRIKRTIFLLVFLLAIYFAYKYYSGLYF
jgi:adenylate cyclase